MADDKVKMSSHKPSSSWWSNALRSIGSSSLDLIKDMAPYTSATVTTVGESAKTVRDNIRKASTSGKSALKAFENSSLVKAAREGLRNAQEDLKSGNLNNQDRQATSGPMAELSAEMDEAFDDVSFGSLDEDAGGDNYNTSITNNYGGDNAYLADSIAEGFKKSTNATIAAGNAQVNALVASTSNSMMANQKFFTEITGKLDSVDKNIGAIVEYLNTNVTKLIDASAAYYTQQSEKKDSEAATDASTIFGGPTSGLNLAEYKKLIEKQFGETDVGGMYKFLAPIIQDGGLAEIIKNPIGSLIKFGGPQLISPALKKSFADFDKSVRMALPAIAERIAEYGESNSNTFLGQLASIFGVKTQLSSTISNRHFSNAQIPWDKESKNALIRVIPGYLGKILQAVRGDDEVERWDNTTMSFRKNSEITRAYLKENEDAIRSAFNDTDLGKTIAEYTTALNQKDKVTGEQFEQLTNMMYQAITARDTRIEKADILNNPNLVKELLAGTGADKDEKLLELTSRFGPLLDLVEEIVHDSAKNGTDGGLGFGRQQARLAYNAKFKSLDSNEEGLYNDDILQQFAGKNLMELTRQSTSGNASVVKSRQDAAAKEAEKEKSKLLRTIDDIRYLLDRGINVRIIKGGKPFGQLFGRSSVPDESGTSGSSTGGESVDQAAATISAIDAVRTDRENQSSNELESYDNRVENAARKGLDKAKGFIDSLLYGGPEAASRNIEETIKEGLRKAGDYAKEHIVNPIANVLLGEKSEDGKRHGGVFHEISSSISDYLLGPQKEGEEREGGFIARVKSKFNDGIDGWAQTFFGDDVEDGETPEQAAERRRKQMKGLVAKGAVGVGAGAVAINLMQGSLLGMAANPALGALLGLGGVIAANSKSFKKLLFGEDEVDEKGEKTGKHIKGLISLRTQEFFKKNGKMILGGAALGVLKSFIFPSSGGILSGIVGGPIAGMLVGAGVAMVKQTGWFKTLMFGKDITDANGNVTGHIDGMKDKIMKFFSKNGGKDGSGGAGFKSGMVLLSTLGGAGLGGLVGAAAGPLIGGLLGAGLGLVANSEKMKTALFGGKGEDGKRHGGLVGKAITGFNAFIFTPLKNRTKELGAELTTSYKRLGLAVLQMMDPLREAFGNLKDTVTQHFANLFHNLERGLHNVLIKPLKGAAKLIAAPLKMVGKGLASAGKAIIKAPGELLTGMVHKFTDFLNLSNKNSAIRKQLRALKDETFGFLKAGFKEMFKPLTDGVKGIAERIGSKITLWLTKKGGPRDAILGFINKHLGTSFASIGEMLKTGFKKLVMAPFKFLGKIIAAPFKLIGAAFKGVGALTRGVTGGVGMLASIGNTKRIEVNKRKLSEAERAKEYFQLSNTPADKLTPEQQQRLAELRTDVVRGKLSLGGMKNAADADRRIDSIKDTISSYESNLRVDDNGNRVSRYQEMMNNTRGKSFGEKLEYILSPGRYQADQLASRTNTNSVANDFAALDAKEREGTLTEQEARRLKKYRRKYGNGQAGIDTARRVANNPKAQREFEDRMFAQNEGRNLAEMKADNKRYERALQTATKLAKGDPTKVQQYMKKMGYAGDGYDHSMDQSELAKAQHNDNDTIDTVLSTYTNSITSSMDTNLQGASEFFNRGLTPGSIYTNDIHSVSILQQIYSALVSFFTGKSVTERDLDKIANPQKYTTAGRLGEKYAAAISTEEGKQALIREWAVNEYGEEFADEMIRDGIGDDEMKSVQEYYMKSHEAEAAKELEEEEAADKESALATAPVARADMQLAGAGGSAIIDQVAPISTGGNKNKGKNGLSRKEIDKLKKKARKAAKGDRAMYHELLVKWGVEEAVDNAAELAPEEAAKSEPAGEPSNDSSEEQNATLAVPSEPVSENLSDDTVDKLSDAIARKNDDENDKNAEILAQREEDQKRAEERKAILSSSNDALEKKLALENEVESRSLLGLIADASMSSIMEMKSHNSVWDSIFSKKGLITAGVIALAPLIFKLFNGGLGDVVKNAINGLGSTLTSVLGDFWNKFMANGGVEGVLRNSLELAERGKNFITGDYIGAITNEEGDVDNLGASVLRSNARTIVKTTGNNASAFLYGAQEGAARAQLGAATKALQNSDEVAALVKNGMSLDEAIDTISHASTQTVSVIDDSGNAVIKGIAGRNQKQVDALLAAGIDDVAKIADSTKDAVKTIDSASDIARTAARYGDDVVEGAAKGAKVLKKVGGKTGNIVSKLVGWTKEAVSKLSQALGKKFGKIMNKCTFLKKLVAQCSDTFLTKVITESFPRFGKVLAKMGISTGTAFIAELVFVGLGALDGTSRTAYMFDCSKNDIDYQMTTISTVFGALLATSVGGVFDIVNSIIEAVCGWNPIKCIAQELYKFLVNDEMDARLKESQEEFKANWKEEAYKRYSENNKDGLEKLSHDEFIGLTDAEIANKSEYDFNDYNNSVNAGLTDQAVKGAVNFGKRTGDRFSHTWSDINDGFDVVGALINTNADVTNTVGDAAATLGRGFSSIASTAGNAWQSGATALYSGALGVFGENGKAAGETIGNAIGGIGATYLEAAGMAVEGVANTASGIIEFGNIGISGLGDMIAGKKSWDDVMNDYSAFWSKTAEGMGQWWKQHTENFNNIWKNVSDSFDNWWDGVTDWWSDITKTQEQRAAEAAQKAEEEKQAAIKAQEEAVETQTEAVATLAKNADDIMANKAMRIRNMKIHTAASGGVVTGDEPILSMLSPGEIVYNPASADVQKRQAIAEREKASEIIHSNALTNDSVIPVSLNENTNTFLLKAIFSAITGRDVVDMNQTGIRGVVRSVVTEKAKKSANASEDDLVDFQGANDKTSKRVSREDARSLRIVDAIKTMQQAIINKLDMIPGVKLNTSNSTDESSSGNGRGASLYQQEDPQWSKGKYKSLDIYNSGCGPTAAAIAASAYGSSINPAQAAAIVNATGNRDSDGGTRPQGIEAVGRMSGIPMTEGAPDTRQVTENLKSGKPVIFMGEDGYAGRGDGVYGDGMHYVVGTDYDAATGSVNIMDPLKKKPSRHPLRQVLGNAASTIYTGVSKLKKFGSGIKERMGRGPLWKSPDNAKRIAENDNAIDFVFDSQTLSMDPNAQALNPDMTIKDVFNQSLMSVYGDADISDKFGAWLNNRGDEDAYGVYSDVFEQDLYPSMKFVRKFNDKGPTYLDTDLTYLNTSYPEIWSKLNRLNMAADMFMDETQSAQMSLPHKLIAANLFRYKNLSNNIFGKKYSNEDILDVLDTVVSNSHGTEPRYRLGVYGDANDNGAWGASRLAAADEIGWGDQIWVPYVPLPTSSYIVRYNYENFGKVLNENNIYADPYYGEFDSPMSPDDFASIYRQLIDMGTNNAQGLASQWDNSDSDILDAIEKTIRDALKTVNPKWGSWTIGRRGTPISTVDSTITDTVSVDVDGTKVSVPEIILFPIFLASRGMLTPSQTEKREFKNNDKASRAAFYEFWNNDYLGARVQFGLPTDPDSSVDDSSQAVIDFYRYFYKEPFYSYWANIEEYFARVDNFIKKTIMIPNDEIDAIIKANKSAIAAAIGQMMTDRDTGELYKQFSGLKAGKRLSVGTFETTILALWKVVLTGKSYGGFVCDNNSKLSDIAYRCCAVSQSSRLVGLSERCSRWLNRAYELCITDEQSRSITATPESIKTFKTVGNVYQLEVLRNLISKMGTLKYVPQSDKDWMNVPAGKACNVGAITWAYTSVFKSFGVIGKSVTNLFDSSSGGKITGPAAIEESDVAKICEDLCAGDVLFYASADTVDSSPNHVEMYMGDGYMLGHYDGVTGPVIHKVTYRLGNSHKLVSVKRFIKNEDNDLHEMEYDLEKGKYAIDGEIEASVSSGNALSTILGIFGELANRLVEGVFTGNWDTDMSSYLERNGGNTYGADESLLEKASGPAQWYEKGDVKVIGNLEDNLAATSGSGRGRGSKIKSASMSRPFSRHKMVQKLKKQNGGYGRGRRKYGRGNQYISAGETVKLPKGAGWYRTRMAWDSIARTEATNQGKLLIRSGEPYDDKGYAKIGDRYLVATTQTFGEAGDYIDVEQSDGSTVKAIIGDIKAWGNPKEPVTKWGHTGGENVLEFIDKRGSHETNPEWCDHPEWNGLTVTAITNRGTHEYVGGSGIVPKSGNISEMSYDKSGHNGTPGSPYISWKVAGGHTKYNGAMPIEGSYEESKYPESAVGEFDGTVSTSTSTSDDDASSGVNTINNTFAQIADDAGASGLNTLKNTFAQLGNDLSAAVFGKPGAVTSRSSSSSSRAYTLGSNNVSTKGSYSSMGIQSKPSSSNSFIPASSVNSSSPLTADGWFTGGQGISGGSWRNSYYSGHTGIDYPAPGGSGIYSPVSGTVVKQVNGPDVDASYWATHQDTTTHWTGFGQNKYISKGGFGNYTVIQDDVTGLCHIFAHQAVPSTLPVGSHVNRGDYIGQVGTTGMSTGNHLHYQISPPNSNGGVNTQQFVDPNEFDYSKFVSGQGYSTRQWTSGSKSSTYKVDNKAVGGGEDPGTSKIITLLETLVNGIESIVTNTGNSVAGLDKVKKAMEDIKIENTTNNNVVAPSVSGGSRQAKSLSTTETYGRQIARGH